MSTTFTGHIKFLIKGQDALPKWQQIAIKQGLDSGDAPPEVLRFTCRIAQDARDNFARIELADGSTLSVHPKAKPQFGKNRDGKAYLTVTLVHSTTGEAYRFRWLGDAVPLKMQQVAVNHDLGKRVAAAAVRLDLSAAEVQPAHVANGTGHRSTRDLHAEKARAAAGRAAGVPPRVVRARRCARIESADVQGAAK